MEWYGNEHIIGGKNGHKHDCECQECTGEAQYERNEARKIKAWDEANIQW